jgi:hypothetical protein
VVDLETHPFCSYNLLTTKKKFTSGIKTLILGVVRGARGG